MPDNMNTEKQQAEALSAAIDALNRGETQKNMQDAELNELVFTAGLIKDGTSWQTAPPPEVLENIVSQAADTLVRNKQKKRLAWGLASLSGAVAAVLLVVLLNAMPPATPDQNLAQAPSDVPAPAEEVTPPAITVPPPNLTTPPARTAEKPPETVKPPVVTPNASDTAVPAEPPAVALVLPQTPVPAAGDTMLALADRKADVVTIDADSKSIRQIYRKGAPDEIIITQVPKRRNTMSLAQAPQAKARKAVPGANESEIKPPDKNKVRVTIEDSEVTVEGSASEEELLNIANSLIKVSVANEK